MTVAAWIRRERPYLRSYWLTRAGLATAWRARRERRAADAATFRVGRSTVAHSFRVPDRLLP